MGIFSLSKRTDKNIQTLFKLDFENSPNEEFFEQGEPMEFDGRIVRTFSKSIVEESDFEAGLFDSIDVKTFEGYTNKNIIFSNESIVIGEEEIELLKKLINGIYECYGKDDSGKKSFSQTDIEDIEFGYWHRDWNERKNPVMLSFDEEGGIFLTIWLSKK